MGIARYIIVLDRYDDDDYAAGENTYNGSGHDGTAEAACKQVADELQEAMEQTGEPAGFFNVVDRRVLAHGGPNVSNTPPEEVAAYIGIDRLMMDGKVGS